MPNKLFAKKRARKAEKRRLRNRYYKKRVKTAYKKVLKFLNENKKDDLINAFKEFQSIVDKATKKGVFHKNNAARKKSRLYKKIKPLLTEK